VDELPKSPSHVILTPDKAAARVRDGEILNLTSLSAGLPPDIAWAYLRRAVEAGSPDISA
jgi:hypothetical protein